MAYNRSTTIGEIICLQSKVLAENDIFKLGKRLVAKIFLQELLALSEGANDEQIESTYKSSSPREDVPDSSEKFWTFIEKEYLHLEDEPKIKFTELSFRVTEDLGKIAANLKFIKQEQDALEEKKKLDGRLTADDRYYRNQLGYFENKNIVAKNEIVDFMTNGIKNHAISKASVRFPAFNLLATSLFGDSPYAFGRAFIWSHRDPYDVRSLDTYSNKFTDLPVSDYRNLIKECRDSPEKFKEIALAYINGIPEQLSSVRKKIEELIGKSHILARRKQVIETMLRHFEEKDYISFVSIAPLQIEGIFADICREIGISENQLDISSLNDKLQHIDGRINSFFYFEYYSFKFPVLRNLVAHGGLVDGELEHTAIQLILDLLPVCELTASKELPINHALKVLNEIGKEKYEELIEWLDLRESVKIPDFYDVNEKIAATDALYTSQGFWEYLEKKLTTLNEIDQIKGCIAVKVAGKIKRSELATEQAEKFLKSSGQIARDAIQERNKILEKVRKSLNLQSQSL